MTFNAQFTQCQDLASDTDASVLTFFKSNINIGQQILETELGSYYTENTKTRLTVAGQTAYESFPTLVRSKQVYVTVGSVRYLLEEIYDERMWQQFQSIQSSQRSDIAQYVFFRRDTFEIYPAPSSSNNTITVIFEEIAKEMTADDYDTGTITTLAAAGTAVTGSGTTWTSAMIGRYIKIDGHPVWYEITAVGSTTTLTIKKPYEGTAIAAGSSTYTIGEIPRTPASTHMIPVYYALYMYFNGIKKDKDYGRIYKNLYETEMERAKTTFSHRYSSGYIPPQRHARRFSSVVNPNNYPINMS